MRLDSSDARSFVEDAVLAVTEHRDYRVPRTARESQRAIDSNRPIRIYFGGFAVLTW